MKRLTLYFIYTISIVFLSALSGNTLCSNEISDYTNLGVYDGHGYPKLFNKSNTTFTIFPTSECIVSVTSSNNTVTITGLTSTANTKLFDANTNPVWECNPWNESPCSNSETVSGLTTGATYFVSVQTDDAAEWIPITVQGTGATTTCNDGIQNQGETGIDCGGPCIPCNVNSNLPDLSLSNLTNFPTSGDFNEAVFFNFDLNNIGNTTATGSYNINFYISTDNSFSSDDIFGGEVPTGGTGVGTIADVTAAIFAPNLSDGDYYLIGIVDDGNAIAESNENNNTISTPFTVGSGGFSNVDNFPDLKLDNFSFGQTIQALTPTTVSVDLINTGVNATGPINVTIYLSEDTQLRDNDIVVGTMSHFGFTSDVVTLTTNITIPTIQSKKYYLIFELDQENNIIESNELNNRYRKPIQLEGIKSDLDCSFISSSFSHLIQSFRSRISVIETTTGYNIYTPQSATNPPESLLGILKTDLLGESDTYELNTLPPDIAYNEYSVDHQFKTTQIFFKNITPLGEIVFNKTIVLDTNIPISFIDYVRTIPWNGGYMLLGSYDYKNENNSSEYGLFTIITDANGNSLSQDFSTPSFGRNIPNPILYGDDGSIYFLSFSIIDFHFIGKINPNGEIVFLEELAGSTLSFLNEIVLSPNGDYLWAKIGSNYQDRITRINTETGDKESPNISYILSSSDLNIGEDSFTGLNFDNDGNVLVAQRWIGFGPAPISGYEIALLSPNFEVIWEHQIDLVGGANIRSLGEVSTGYLFLISGTNKGRLVKVDLDGNLTEECEDDIDNGSCTIAGTANGSNILLTGMTSDMNLKVFDQAFGVVFECNPWNNNPCSGNETISNLPVGQYFLSVSSDNCDEWIQIMVQGGTTTTTCTDGIQNQGETGIDCGGPCAPCAMGGCNVEVSSSNGNIIITGLTAAENTKVFDANTSPVWECNPWNGSPCSNSETISGLITGATYFVSVQSDDCEEWIPVTVQGSAGNLPDLTLANLGPLTGAPGQVVFFDFDLINLGNISTGSYDITSYISTDGTISNDDVMEGNIATGNTFPGTQSGVVNAITIPNLQPGTYSFIMRADDNFEIAESNESNNTLTTTLTITSSANSGRNGNSNASKTLKIAKVFPNPNMYEGFVAVESALNQTVQLEVYNAVGALQNQLTTNIETGNNVIELAISDLKAGMYYLIIKDEKGQTVSTRFVKQVD